MVCPECSSDELRWNADVSVECRACGQEYLIVETRTGLDREVERLLAASK